MGAREDKQLASAVDELAASLPTVAEQLRAGQLDARARLALIDRLQALGKVLRMSILLAEGTPRDHQI